MIATTEKIEYGKEIIEFELVQEDRTTLSIEVLPIKANKDCIDYVIYHELCHCMYFAHNKEFYTLLESKCKDWSKLKNKLETLTL